MCVRVALLLLAGGFAAQHSRLHLSWDHAAIIFVAIVSLAPIRCTRALATLLVGVMLFHCAVELALERRLDPQFAGDSMLTRVQVVGFPQIDGDTVHLVVSPIDDPRLPKRARVSWYQPPALPRLGDRWQLELRLRRPRGSANPGGFDLEGWMLRERLHASGYVVGGRRNRLIASGTARGIQNLRQRALQGMRESGAAAVPVLAAVGVGTRHLIPDERWQQFAVTGTSHLIAISGLHVGLAGAFAFAMIYAGTAGVGVRGNVLRVAAIGSVVCAACYAVFSGFGVPAQRATLMLLLAVTAVLAGRQPNGAHLLAIASLVVFVTNPLSIMAPGFVLSFGAVAVLLIYSRGTLPQIRSWRHPLRAVGQVVSMQLYLLMGLMPLTIAIFDRVALLAPVANLIAVPVFSLLVVPAMLAALVLSLPAIAATDSIATALYRLASSGVEAIDHVTGELATLPFADLLVAGGGKTVAVAALLPLLWVILPRAWPGRGVVWLALAMLILHRPLSPPPGCFDTTVLDVGQGLAVVVEAHDFAMLYDTGPAFQNGASAADAVILPYLRHRGIDALDLLVVSHGDLDHAGGVATVIDRVLARRLVTGERLALTGTNTFDCRAGQRWSVHGVDISVLHPPIASTFEGNDRSCVLEVRAGQRRLLLPGDIEAAAEALLVGNPQLRRADVVIVPHHGSLTSSSPALVNRLTPAYAIATVGAANRWGFPKQRVVQRWSGAGAEFLSTAEHGAIRYRSCAWRNRPRLMRERQQRRRSWHDRD